MKIYFAGSIRGDAAKKETFKQIIDFLKKQGHTVLTEHIAVDNIQQLERKNTDDYIYKRDIAWLENSDVVVAEATGPSFGVGFEVAYAASLGKQVYLFYDKNAEKSVSAMVTGNCHEKIKVVPYADFSDIEKVLFF